MKKYLLRDGALLLVTISLALWSPSAPAAQVISGICLALSAYIFHEWAHLLGALSVNANISAAKSIFSPFLFSFSSEQNSLQQFHYMTTAGFVATAVYLWAYILVLPTDTLWGQVALTLACWLAALTLLIEGPIAIYSIIYQKIPAVEIPLIGQNPILDRLIKQIFL